MPDAIRAPLRFSGENRILAALPGESWTLEALSGEIRNLPPCRAKTGHNSALKGFSGEIRTLLGFSGDIWTLEGPWGARTKSWTPIGVRIGVRVYPDEVRAEAVEAVRLGFSLAEAAELVGCSKSTGAHRTISPFCDHVCMYVRFRPDHEAITAELTAHLLLAARR